MKLTNKLEAEVLKTYHAYWDGYLKGDVISMAAILDDNYTQVGSAETEVFFSKEDAVNFLYDTIDQVAGKAEIRNQVIKLEQIGEFYIVHDLFDAYVLDGENWIFYAKFRATTLMHEVNGQWKFLHQHSSVPDIRTQDGENIAIDKISAENLQLKDAIKRRTVELEQKNRELEIEASLERVRAVAMGMNKPDDMLDVCQTISLQLESLGVKDIRNVQTAIFYENRGTYMNYEYYARHHKTLITETVYTNHEVAKAFAEKMLKGKGEISITLINGKQVQDWLAYQKTTNVFIDTFLETATSLNYYWHSLGPVALGISTYSPLTKDELNLFQRFLHVFELAYTRYLDIEQAVAQAREAQIQLALERVRARTMAMQNSEELSETSYVLFQQFKELGEGGDKISIGIFEEDETAMKLYATTHGSQLTQVSRIEFNNHPVYQKIFSAWKEQKKFFITELTGKELESLNKFKFENPDYEAGSEDELPRGRWVVYTAFFSNGLLSYGSNVNRSAESIQLLERFAAVFNQTYTRFLDLQKAEAQAREATIETSLERVRSRSMAMHSSNELKEVITVVMEQFKQLGFYLDLANFNINNTKDWSMWLATPDYTYPEVIHIPYIKHPLFDSPFKALKNGLNFFSDILTKEEKNSVVRHLYASTVLDQYDSEERKKYAFAGKGFARSVVFMKHIILTISNYNAVPYTDEQNLILQRFAKAFEQAYTRFLDLQKAEAQAREAQIETALERVRSRTMGMQKSEELKEVIKIVYQQLNHLKINLDHAGFVVDYTQGGDWHFWIADEQDIPSKITHPYFESVWANQFNEAKEKGADFFATHLNFEEKNKFYNELLSYVPGLPEASKDFYLNCPGLAASTVLFDNVSLYIENFSGIPYTDDENKTLMRFGKVFQQTYTRFLDLQKAETQARESQIQLALERVRARTMAMQRSEDLFEVIREMNTQLLQLNFRFDSTDFITDYSDKGYNIWLASVLESFATPVYITSSDTKIARLLKEVMERGHNFFTFRLNKEEKNKYFDHVFETSIAKDASEESKKYIYDAGGMAVSCFVVKNIILSVANFASVPYTDAENDIIKRFAYVFEQSYTRFLDLQKAEAQAREAQIELALERVRARAMAMQHSDELKELIGTVYTELTKLDIILTRCLIWIMDSENFSSRLWMANPESQPVSFYVPYHENPPYLAFVKAWKERNTNWQYDLHGSVKKDWDEYVFHNTEMKHLPEPVKKEMAAAERSTLAASFHNFGCLQTAGTEPLKKEQFDILNRFARVFDLTYTRFADLKKAEAQAREGQIQLALERVRARTMAMQRSDEIKDVALTILDKMVELGIEMNGGVSLVTFFPDSKDLLHWLTIGPDFINVRLSYFDHIIFKECTDAREKEMELFANVYSGDIKTSYFKHLMEQTGFSAAPQDLKDWVNEQSYFGFSFAIQKNSGIFLNDYTGKFFSGETNKILIRFAKVFEQAYVRFLDLQKAEAQAREAQIEASLERVRSKAMAMHESSHLTEAAGTVFTELNKLGINPIRSGFVLLNNNSRKAKLYPATSFDKENTVSFTGEFEFTGHTVYERQYESWQKKENYFPVLEGEELKSYYKILSEGLSIPYENFPTNKKQFGSFLPFTEGFLFTWSDEPCSENEINILGRFKGILDLTIRRFLDLQKAEAQAREAQIQLALERVRARTMAMQKSEELPDAANLLFLQVQALGMPAWSAGYCIWDEDKQAITLWMSSECVLQPSFKVPLTEDPSFIHMLEGSKNGESFFVEEIGGEALKRHYEYLRTIPGVRESLEEIEAAGFPVPTFQIFHLAYFLKGFLLFITYEPVPEAHDIFKRFGKVFDQTYTRFLDLKKAEAQAREAQIEMSLERIRSSSMAMHSSEELQKVIQVLTEQLSVLGFHFHTANFITNESMPDWEIWISSPGVDNALPKIHVPYMDHILFNERNTSIRAGKEFLTRALDKEEKDRFFHYLFENTTAKFTPEERKQWVYEQKGMGLTTVLMKNISLSVINYDGTLYTKEENDVIKRLAAVFEQSYTRFLDLQKAETQAREAQIEAALERVRSRSMAMHKSEELLQVISVVSEQLQQLNFKFNTVSFAINNQAHDYRFWFAVMGNPTPLFIEVPYLKNPMFDRVKEVLANGGSFYTDTLTLEENRQWHEHVFANADLSFLTKETKEYILRSGYARSVAITPGIMLIISNYAGKPYTDGENDTIRRFAVVFEQSYTRFLDLQKAEAQAREAQIEASLERVRSKAMAMQKSGDLTSAVATVFEEMDNLCLELMRCGIGIIHKENRCAKVWTTTISDNDTTVQVSGDESMDIHPLLQGAFEAWENQAGEYEYILKGEDLNNYYQALTRVNINLPESQILLCSAKDAEQYFYAVTFSAGNLFAFRDHAFPEEAKIVMKRFADVFDFTYTRFTDLKQAEAQAREAKIETALERVRSRTLAMQKSDELAETASVLFKQLIQLGIEPNRLYINIIKDKTGEAEFWITDEDGSKVSTAYTTNMNGNPSFKKMYDGWKEQKQSLVMDMHGEELETYFRYLTELHVTFKEGPEQKRRLQYIAYFSKGFIGMASPDEQPQETVFLLERFAAVFNLTFTRFNDLKIAEAHAVQAEEDLIKLQTEKRRAEDALSELQVTQKQLIQSEKMASLGELTAGIAHEIQNPLNFVNNFSEVSNELIEELKSEKSKDKSERDEKLEDELLNDIAQNLQKINNHGKRADAIVKGMLQHSRSSSSQKEPTDINALCDEYLRLCYHGLRAKDKSFNATIKTDFDGSIGKINIVHQDIGRVMLNLLTNAFYAASLPSRHVGTGSEGGGKGSDYKHEPTVWVSTKKIADKVLISVKDNGPGIPQNIIDKIFQPFFTTKPTGQGTGLGLSLSYDIVKAHGGELKVETKEGEETEFVIQLPVV